jgi:hypothetical protein
MRQTAVLLSLLWSGTAFAADPQLMNLVMPDAKILAGFNATSAIASPLGQFILSKINQSGTFPQDLITATGFNPFQDVTEVLAATAGDPSNPGGLVLARGTFPVEKITTSLTGGNANWQVTAYGGDPLVSIASPRDKVAHAVAFIGNSIAVAGDLASVKAAIDRQNGSNSIDPALAVAVNRLSGSQDEWLVSSVPVGSLIPSNAPAGTAAAPTAPIPLATVLPILKNIQYFSGGVKFGDNVVITAEAVANSPENASALNAVIKLGVTLGASLTANAAKNPQLTAVVQLLQALQVTANGSDVELSLSIPEAQIEALLKSLPAPAKAVASARPPAIGDIASAR